MITWMQRHKRWLIITIWISTIAFVGAGFVGWGQYSYGDKAGAVAKVGSVEISMGELQKTYSSLYARYNQMFQGNFDEEKAKQFGLQKQALEQLIQKSLIINLAKSYDLEISDKELVDTLKTQSYFFKDGTFDKETYKQVLSQNRLSTKEYEADLKKDLLIQKALKLLPVQETQNEINAFNILENIADKINYKVLTQNSVVIETSDEFIKPFWEKISQNFMTEVSYEVKYIKQDQLSLSYSDDEISKYYNENKTHFKDQDGKLLSLEDSKSVITEELNAKATKEKALRVYIDYKKGNIPDGYAFENKTISASNNIFNEETLSKISELTVESPYMKPINIDGIYYTFELVKINPSVQKTYEQAKPQVLNMYIAQTKREKLKELANAMLDTFSGDTTGLITIKDSDKLTNLSQEEANEFLEKLFVSNTKRSYIVLNSGKIVLFYILEQRLLDNSNNNSGNLVAKFKHSMFNEALIKTLQNKYQTEIFIQGL